MDTTNQIYSYVVSQTHSNTTSFWSALFLSYLDVRYKRAITAITDTAQEFFQTWGDTTTLTTQNEYTMDKFTFPDTTTRDIISITGVSVKFKTDSDFYRLKKSSMSALDADFTQYSDWGWEPFYFVWDKSIFIAPNPLENVTGGLRIYGNYRPLKLTLSDSETEIKIPLLYTYVLADWICADYWTSQGKYDQATWYENKFSVWIQEMVKSLSIRDREIMWYTY